MARRGLEHAAIVTEEIYLRWRHRKAVAYFAKIARQLGD